MVKEDQGASSNDEFVSQQLSHFTQFAVWRSVPPGEQSFYDFHDNKLLNRRTSFRKRKHGPGLPKKFAAKTKETTWSDH